MNKVEVLHDKMTARGRELQTKRVWQTYCDGKIADVTVYTESCINSRSTWSDRDAAYNRTIYQCECGRTSTSWRRPTKKYLNTHNSWWTTEQREQLLRSLNEDVRP